MTMPSLDKVREAWEAADQQERFWHECYQEFLEKYPEQLVAVHEGAVVATSHDLQQLVFMVRDKGLDPREVWVRFITVDPLHMLL